MPQTAIMAGLGLGGSLLSGFGRSGKQGETQEALNRQTQESTRENQTYSGERTPVEQDYFSQFRKGLVPLFEQEVKRAQEPIYGDAQKASLVSSLNDAAQKAVASLSARLARSGGLDSGRWSAGVGDIESERLGKLTDFFANLPLMEEQARRSGVGGLLGQGIQWAGAAPVGERTSGSGSGERSGTSTTTGTNTQTLFGTPWQSGFMQQGGALSGALFNYLLGKGFGKPSAPAPWNS